MFQLTKEEVGNLMSQFATSSIKSQNAITKDIQEDLKSQNVTSSLRLQNDERKFPAGCRYAERYSLLDLQAVLILYNEIH